MGRLIKRDGAEGIDDAPEPQAPSREGPPLVPGGAPGYVAHDSSEPPVLKIPGMDALPRATPPEAPGSAREKQYVVVSGPETIMYDSCRYPLKVGRVYKASHVSIDKLKAQGVVFEERDG